MRAVPDKKPAGLFETCLNGRESQAAAIVEASGGSQKQRLRPSLRRASRRARRWPLCVSQAQQLDHSVGAPGSPRLAVPWHPTMALAIIPKPSPHVHRDLRRLNRLDRNAALLNVLKKLSTRGAAVLSRMIGIARGLQMSAKGVQNLDLSNRGKVMAATPE